VKTGRRSVNLPFVEILAVFIEDLDAVIVPIVHENVAGLLVNGDTMHVAEIAGTSVERFVIASSARAAFNAPLHEEFSVLVKLGDAGSRVAIGDEESAIREPVDIRRTIEVIGVFAGNFGVPIVCRSLLPSCVNLYMVSMLSSTIHTFFSGS